jgi:hypothetical protein
MECPRPTSRDLNAALSGMQFQIWPLKMEAAGGKSQRKFGGVHAMVWLLVAAQSGRSSKQSIAVHDPLCLNQFSISAASACFMIFHLPFR